MHSFSPTFYDFLAKKYSQQRKNPFCSLVKVCEKVASFNSHQERAVTYLKILEDPIQEPYTFIASMIANNLCRHLILNSVEHSADAVLFLINILPPLSKCTICLEKIERDCE